LGTLNEDFINGLIDYVKTHSSYADLSKEDAMKEIVSVLLNDIGAAQGYLHEIGLKIDLYEMEAK
jgi:hypothetical protein